MRRTLFLLTAIVLSASAFSCIVHYEEPRRAPVVRPVPPPPPPPIGWTVGTFYDALDPWGDWVWSDSWGWVWSPSRVQASWRPYWDGRWVWTVDGWYWLSDEPWAWAVYHYGRWTWAPGWGWVWIPGRDWAPAWVSWRYGSGWIGWAPLPPGAVWASGRLDIRVTIDVDRWCFVEDRRFVEPRVGRYAVPVGRNVTLVRETRDTTRYAVEGNRVVNRSVDAERIREATRQEVPRYRLQDVDSHTRAGSGPEGSREVRVWRPPIASPPAEARPRRAAPGRIEKEREEPEPRVAPAPPARPSLPKPPEATPAPPLPPRDPASRPGRVARPRAVEPSAPEAEQRRLERDQAAERERLTRQQAEEARRAADETERKAIEARQAEERRVQEAQAAREQRLLDARRRRAEAKEDKKEGKEERKDDEKSEEAEPPPR